MNWKITDLEGNKFPKNNLPFQRVKNTEEPVYGVKHAIDWPNGERKYLSTNASPLFDEDDEFDGVLVVIEDITGRKRSKQRRDHLNSVLRSVQNINRLLVKTGDREELLKGVCKNLTKTRDYLHAWISLLDDSGKLVTSAQAGMSYDFEDLRVKIYEDQLLDCLSKSLEQSEVIVVSDPTSECDGYPIAGKKLGNHSVLAIRLEHGGKVYGVLSAAIPTRFAKDEEEQKLFAGVAEDVGFGLHNIDVGEDLRRRENQLQRSQEIAKVGSWQIDLNTEKLDCSEETFQIFGLPRNGPLTYDDYLESVHPEDRDFVDEEWKKALEGEEYELEHRIIVDGNTKWVREKAEVIFDEEGNPREVVGSAQDITERKKAEVELERSESKFRAISERVHDGLFIYNGDKFEWVNDKGAEILGYSKKELYKKSIWSLLHPEDRGRVKKLERKGLEGKEVPSTYEARVLRKDDKVRNCEFAVSLIEFNGKQAVLGAARDITERKKAERKLEQRAKHERLLRQQSARFLKCRESGLDLAINEGLTEIGELLDVARTYIFQLDWELEVTSNTHEWCRKGIEPQKDKLQNVPLSSIPTWMDSLRDLETIHIPSVPDLPESWSKEKEILEAQNIQSLVVVPISYNQKLLGFAGFDAVREKRKWSNEEIDLLQVFGDLTGSAFHLSDTEEKLRENEQRLRQSFVELAETTSRVLGVRDPYTQEHEQRVAELAREIGRRMGLDEETLLGLYIGGVLHDIGKIAIPETILTKPGELKEVEWEMIRSHPKVGYDRILEDTDFPWPVVEMTLHHHERLDGSGYPDGLKGDELTTEVRILGAVDVVEAMSTRRPYREARSKERTLNVIKEGKGDKFDPEVVDILVEMIEEGVVTFGEK